LLAALVAIPVTLRGLGTERFGALSLAWLLIGYLSLFDLGLGRALTKLAAERLARSGSPRRCGTKPDRPSMSWGLPCPS